MAYKFLKSLTFALRGIRIALSEQNFCIQVFFAFLVIFFMIILRVRPIEAAVLILAIMFVLALEIMNSIFERFSDILKPRMHAYVAYIKDLMAAAVLLSSIASIGIGILIFWPYIRGFFL